MIKNQLLNNFLSTSIYVAWEQSPLGSFRLVWRMGRRVRCKLFPFLLPSLSLESSLNQKKPFSSVINPGRYLEHSQPLWIPSVKLNNSFELLLEPAHSSLCGTDDRGVLRPGLHFHRCRVQSCPREEPSRGGARGHFIDHEHDRVYEKPKDFGQNGKH